MNQWKIEIYVLQYTRGTQQTVCIKSSQSALQWRSHLREGPLTICQGDFLTTKANSMYLQLVTCIQCMVSDNYWLKIFVCTVLHFALFSHWSSASLDGFSVLFLEKNYLSSNQHEQENHQYGRSLVSGNHQCRHVLSWNSRLNKLYTAIQDSTHFTFHWYLFVQ